MSGGGPRVPNAPDLSGNVRNANNTFSTATSNAGQTFNTAVGYNQNAQDNLKNVTSQTNSMAGQIGAQADQNIKTYGSTFVPLQAQQAQQAQQYGSDANVQKLQGMAVANTNAADQAARANSAAALASEGVDPASIHGAALDRQASVQNAGQVAAASTQSALNTQNTAIGLTQQANQLGLQVGQQGTAGAATAAGVANQGQQTINQTNNSGIGNLQGAATYLNTGINANNSGVNANQAQFGDQMSSYKANQAQQNGQLDAVGSIVGAASQFLQKGGTVSPNVGGLPPAGVARTPLAHSGLPVVHGAVRPRQAIPMPFEPMDAGGPVTEQGALPIGTFPGTTDRKPAMLTPGEFVVPQDAVQHMGAEYWHKQVDKAREMANKRRAIPINHPPHMSMQ